MKKQKIGRATRSSTNEGSALIICLILVVLITILVVGFAMTARMERQSSAMHLAGQEARMLAKMGADVVSSRILTATSDKTKAWISSPGRIIVTELGDTESAPEVVELASGSATSVEPNISVDLNAPALLEPEGLVAFDSTLLLPQRWVYVRRDGSHEPAETAAPTYDANNPVIGRYAYWADDDSTKINWNTAWTRGSSNTASFGHPSRIDLKAAGALEDQDLEDLREFRTERFFNSPSEPKALVASPNIRQLVRDEKLSFTHYNHSPDINLFNEPRRVLTTNPAMASERPYFNIVRSQGTDPGIVANLNTGETENLINSLLGELLRKDWPLLPGRSFVDKYGLEAATQIVLNLVDYVRSAESAEEVVEPLRGTLNGSTFRLEGGGAFMSVGRKLLITEMGVFVPSTPGEDGSFQCQFKIEVYFPESTGSGTCDLTKLFLYTNLRDTSGASDTFESAVSASQVTGNPIMQPGDRRVITATRPISAAERPVQLRVRAAISKASGSMRLDITPPALGSAPGDDYIFYTVDPPEVAEGEITSVAVDDPFVNKIKTNWRPGPNTFGGAPVAPTSTLGGPSGAVPQQDTDANGNVVNGARVPAAGAVVQSVGELGYVHSGGQGHTMEGVPWRTLRLQPRLNSDSTLPDWLLLDLFSAPLQMPGPRDKVVLQPETQSLGGLINLNTMLPIVQGDALAENSRLLPLIALFQNTAGGTNDTAKAETLAMNLIEKMPAQGQNPGKLFGHAYLEEERLYSTPGEIAEIAGIADRGEESESLVREVLGHITTRGNVFSVYSIGQSVRQSPSGAIQVVGEFRSLTVLERRSNEVRVVFERKLGL